MILIIDNYDSFTYNIVQYVGEINKNIYVEKNDKISIKKINNMQPSHIIISPGPGKPCDAGNCMDIIKYYYQKIPILGVCLGHQAIGETFGCNVKKHTSVVHGKTSLICHDKISKLYNGIPDKFDATRYHSLIIDNKNVDNNLKINAWLSDRTIMGIEHIKYPLYGVQFHPESIKTDFGKKIIKNFINIV